jgi:ribulose-phosphate 3-epimerase
MNGQDIVIAPSILSADFARLGEEIALIEKGGADWVHVDVMDGQFVPNITIGLPVVKALKAVTDLPLDVHLMINDADRYVTEFVASGAHSVSVHVEACTHLHRTLDQIRSAGALAGVALNPATPLEWVEPVLDHIDFMLLMTVNPGFGGQRFIPSVLPKIRKAKQWIQERNLSIDIQVDGGIGPGNIGEVYDAGATHFVAGSAVFNQPNYGDAISALRSGVQGNA